MLREYDSIEPVILSGQFLIFDLICLSIYLFPLVLVGEDEEVSIKEVTDAIVKAVGFQGEYTVCFFLIN
jgi:GDP-L-fucose synthase